MIVFWRVRTWNCTICFLAVLIVLACSLGYMTWRASRLEAENARMYEKWERSMGKASQLSDEIATLSKRIVKLEKDLAFARAARQPLARISRSFPIQGAKTIILRAGVADEAQVKTLPGAVDVAVSGFPVGGAIGYHPADPNFDWITTLPERRGLDFKSELHGTVLVISTTHEINYVHHQYVLNDMEIVVPPGIEVVKEKRELNGDGSPSLSLPASPPAS